jgi:hypothetical protein
MPQMALFGQLQDVVVKLSQAAVSEKSKLAHMQKQLDSYQVLVKEQDRVIDELRSVNAKLQKERDALVAFRGASSAHLEVVAPDYQLLPETPKSRRSASLGHSPSATNGVDECLSVPKSKSFVQSLVDQLREEKRLRYQVEEQSSLMIGEQQITIHRLEERLTRQISSPIHPSAARSPRPSLATPQTPTKIPSSLPHSVSQMHPLHHNSSSSHAIIPSLPLAHSSSEFSLRMLSNASPIDAAYSAPSIRMTPEDLPGASRSVSVCAASDMSMDNASQLLQAIKLRHGL